MHTAASGLQGLLFFSEKVRSSLVKVDLWRRQMFNCKRLIYQSRLFSKTFDLCNNLVWLLELLKVFHVSTVEDVFLRGFWHFFPRNNLSWLCFPTSFWTPQSCLLNFRTCSLLLVVKYSSIHYSSPTSKNEPNFDLSNEVIFSVEFDCFGGSCLSGLFPCRMVFLIINSIWLCQRSRFTYCFLRALTLFRTETTFGMRKRNIQIICDFSSKLQVPNLCSEWIFYPYNSTDII